MPGQSPPSRSSNAAADVDEDVGVDTSPDEDVAMSWVHASFWLVLPFLAAGPYISGALNEPIEHAWLCTFVSLSFLPGPTLHALSLSLSLLRRSPSFLAAS